MTLPLIFIVGPTAIGKSSFAINLAKKINGEIINADSMQVYKDLNILTARPSKEDIKTIPHHLYGYIKGEKRYNVANWCKDISLIIKNNNTNNVHSIIVGGTGMYIDKLINGLIDIPSIPEDVKKESEKYILENGINKFIKEVKKIDPESFKNISINDINRLRRIWEVYNYTNIKFSNWLKNKNNNYLPKQDYKLLLFTPDRNEIYSRVNRRFEEMMEKGAINEVKKLISLNLDNSLPIMRAHGVPEISSYLLKSITFDECILKGQQVTRNYVKRQLTWWRSTSLRIYGSFDKFPSNIDLNSLKLT
ncbi:MAG: tRNA dimethylallyltransferase [Alphaproteobacteria bacterium MarineAlpha5_Bin6]|nr:MAG: tRNA dimethylallyltransferase [Alphaproteobacteria bacterium MarineAlpha5_Bin7]PPR53068.1 MAG: tRNA dimethylallyltransferase [Alphaproteobacteria bacterium MarineAlpha5_Bin6]